jgi:hypothetical protein
MVKNRAVLSTARWRRVNWIAGGLANFRKLSRELAHNAASLAQRHASNGGLSRYYKRVRREAKQLKRGR